MTNQWTPSPLPQHVWDDDVKPQTTGKDITLSAESHIYFSDGPGLSFNTTNAARATQQYIDLKNWFTASIYGKSFQVSDIAKWHSQTITKTDPADNTKLILDPNADQLLGDGWIDIPLSPQ